MGEIKECEWCGKIAECEKEDNQWICEECAIWDCRECGNTTGLTGWQCGECNGCENCCGCPDDEDDDANH